MPIKVPTSAGYFKWRPASWVHVTGEDAGAFLQGQFTNDLRTLESSSAVYGLWLSVKGKVLADSFVLRDQKDQAFWIGSYFSPSQVIRERLESHIIADDVMLEDGTGEWAGVSVFGADAIASLAARRSASACVFAGRRGHEECLECMYRLADGEPDWLDGLPGAELDRDAMERRRIEAGIPAIPIDIGPGDLPNEGGLETDAISYSKGCYLGQEVMARLKSMGQVRRRLWRAHGNTAGWPPLPAPVFKKERQVGELRSAVHIADGWTGLAMISLLHAGPGAELSFEPNGAGALQLQGTP